MQIIDNGVLLDSEEFQRFFEQHCEGSNFVYEEDGGYVIGDITAISADDRLVLSVDNVTTELYSAPYHVLAVVTSDLGYTVTMCS